MHGTRIKYRQVKVKLGEDVPLRGVDHNLVTVIGATYVGGGQNEYVLDVVIVEPFDNA